MTRRAKKPEDTPVLCMTCRNCQAVRTLITRNPEHETVRGIYCGSTFVYPALYCENYVRCKKGKEPAFLVEGYNKEAAAE